MALPDRHHFDIESAAVYLGCSVNDLRYYLDEGMLRCAFHVTENWMPMDAFAHDGLSQVLREAMYQLPGSPEQNDFENIRRAIPALSRCPEFLYVSSYHRRATLEQLDESGRAIYYFESFQGELLNIWSYGRLDYVWVFRGEDGELRDAVFPKEELDRLSGASSRTTPIEQKAEAQAKVQEYLYPNRADEKARIMTDCMNQYIREFNRKASSQELQDYIIETTDYISYDRKGKDLVFRDDEHHPDFLSVKDFRSRYKKYFG